MHQNVKQFLLTAAVLSAPLVLTTTLAAQDPRNFVSKLGIEEDLHVGSVIDQEVLGAINNNPFLPQIERHGGNVQVSDPGLDYVQIFSGFRPFVRATQSEVSAASHGKNLVVTYNNSAGLHVIPNPSGPGLVVDRVKLSGFSTSNDGGSSWTSGNIPGSAAGGQTDGDPSLGVDRHGVFYFAGLGTAGPGGANFGIFANKSTDGGRTWSNAVTVQVDNSADKEWLAVGPDPKNDDRDNVYITWTSFQPAACQLRFARSVDGGATFATKTIFVPTANANPAFPQNCLQFSNIVVDPERGTLYVPFLRFSNMDQDFIQMLISDDAGDTFHLATFNVPGAPDPTVYPVTAPGELTACGGSNLRLTIHGTANPGPGRFGFPRYVNASRLTLQPAAAARNGKVYLAWNNSTSPSYGDPAGHSNILFIRSDNGGHSWTAPVIANPYVTSDPHHVLPSLTLGGEEGGTVHISYYTQHADGSIDLDMVTSNNRGATFPVNKKKRVTSQSFNLPPTNIALTGAPNFAATNYDRQIAVCYALGEYQSLTADDGSILAAWGDARNQLTEPVNALDPISGLKHSEQDVFIQQFEEDD